MFNKIRLSPLPAALCIGGYSGWVLTVMYICERSLYYYRDDSMLDSVNITFLLALTSALAALVIVLLLLDIEGLLSNRLLRLMPGVFMAESGIALCVANANSMKIFSAFAGVAAASGIMASLSQLLRIKVKLRMRTIGAGLALGAGARLLAVWIISSAPQKYFFWVAIGVGFIAALTVHSTGFFSPDAPLVSRAEAAPHVILRKIPSAYLWLFVLCACFCLSYTSIENNAFSMLPAGMESRTYEFCAYSGYLAAAVIVALFVTLSQLPMLFVCAAGMAAAAGCLALLPHFSITEIKIFAVICFAAVACYKASILLFIIVFSLDRPHPLFYAVLGYAISAAGELFGNMTRSYTSIKQIWLVCLLLFLMPFSGFVLSHIMSRSGLSQAGFEHRRTMRYVIRKKSAELDLFEREQMMVECVVLDGYNVDELASKLIFSRNTVRALLRPVLNKFGVSDLDGLRGYFDQLTREQESFQEQVQEAEDKKRSEKRQENVSGFIRAWREHLYQRDAKKEQKARSKARKAKKKASSARRASARGTGSDAADVPVKRSGKKVSEAPPEPVDTGSDSDSDYDLDLDLDLDFDFDFDFDFDSDPDLDD